MKSLLRILIWWRDSGREKITLKFWFAEKVGRLRITWEPILRLLRTIGSGSEEYFRFIEARSR